MPTSSYGQRLRQAVEQAPRRLVRLWLWPGMQTTHDALRSASQPWSARPQGSRSGVWYWPAGGAVGDGLAANEAGAANNGAANEAGLAPAERLWFFATRRRPPATDVMVSNLAIEQLLPSVAELGELLEQDAELSEPQLTQLHQVTDGWPEPAKWLASRWAGTRELGHHLDSPEFRQFVFEDLLSAVEPDTIEALTRLAQSGDDAERLRESWLDEPARLGALEVAERAWGWLRLGRLPRVLNRVLGQSSESSGAKAIGAPASRPRRESLAAETGPPVQPEPRFRLQLLGWPRILRRRSDGSYLETQWRLRRSLSMVAFLALRSDLRASREELLAAIWPDASLETIRKNFHPATSDARRALGSKPNPIVFRQGVYMLDSGLGWDIDCRRFEQWVSQARGEMRQGGEGAAERSLQMLEKALGYYRGPLLEGIEAEWVAVHRQRLRRVKLNLLLQMGDLARHLDKDLKALDAYRALLVEEPFEEHIHLKTMQLYARQGRRDLVRRQYIRLQELLKELNVEPAAETQDRYHQLMR